MPPFPNVGSRLPACAEAGSGVRRSREKINSEAEVDLFPCNMIFSSGTAPYSGPQISDQAIS
jgi:hypothetical protein